jgi:hypothetical protein
MSLKTHCTRLILMRNSPQDLTRKIEEEDSGFYQILLYVISISQAARAFMSCPLLVSSLLLIIRLHNAENIHGVVIFNEVSNIIMNLMVQVVISIFCSLFSSDKSMGASFEP